MLRGKRAVRGHWLGNSDHRQNQQERGDSTHSDAESSTQVTARL